MPGISKEIGDNGRPSEGAQFAGTLTGSTFTKCRRELPRGQPAGIAGNEIPKIGKCFRFPLDMIPAALTELSTNSILPIPCVRRFLCEEPIDEDDSRFVSSFVELLDIKTGYLTKVLIRDNPTKSAAERSAGCRKHDCSTKDSPATKSGGRRTS